MNGQFVGFILIKPTFEALYGNQLRSTFTERRFKTHKKSINYLSIGENIINPELLFNCHFLLF